MDDQQAQERMLKIINHQGNINQNHIEIAPHTYQKGYHQKKKTRQITTVGKEVEKWEHCALLVGM